ncbi:hypothetical protein, partial [Streptomyces capoamus]
MRDDDVPRTPGALRTPGAPGGPAPRRRSVLAGLGAVGAAVALPPALTACSTGPESTDETWHGGR